MKTSNPDLSGTIIGAVIRVHQELGPGFLESVYEEAIRVELEHLNLRFIRQCPVTIHSRGRVVGNHRLDIFVESRIVVEPKTITAFEPIHFATPRSYLKATGCPLGLSLNFAATTLQVNHMGREWHARSE